MGLALYTSPSIDSIIDDKNPFNLTFHGEQNRSSLVKLVYLHNEDPTKYYNNIEILPVVYDSAVWVPAEGESIGYWAVSSSDDQYLIWKFLEKNTKPFEDEWKVVSENNTCTYSQDIGSVAKADIVTFFPLWVRVEKQRKLKVQTLKLNTLSIVADEGNVV